MAPHQVEARDVGDYGRGTGDNEGELMEGQGSRDLLLRPNYYTLVSKISWRHGSGHAGTRDSKKLVSVRTPHVLQCGITC